MELPPMTVIVYGIPHCDSVKQARALLVAQGVALRFHDFKQAGVPPDRLAAWVASAGWQRLLNRQGSTWRRLDAAARAAVADAASAQVLMLAQPSLIKRPVVEWPDGAISVGLDDTGFRRQLSAAAAAQSL